MVCTQASKVIVAQTFLCKKGPSRWAFDVPYKSQTNFNHVVTKPLEVAAAEYGLGAFATKAIKKDEFIGGGALPYDIYYRMLTDSLEYVGEIYYTCEHTSRPYAPNLLMKPTDRARITGT